MKVCLHITFECCNCILNNKVFSSNGYVKAVQLTFLIFSFLAKVDDDLGRAGVERVEVGAVLAVQALQGELVDTTETFHKFPEKAGFCFKHF